jgi:hypothetical protein
VFDRLIPPVQDQLSLPQSGQHEQLQQDSWNTHQKGRSIWHGGIRRKLQHQRQQSVESASSSKKIKRTTVGDIIKIGTTDVIINGNNEVSMTFDESTRNSEEKSKVILITTKTADTNNIVFSPYLSTLNKPSEPSSSLLGLKLLP